MLGDEGINTCVTNTIVVKAGNEYCIQMIRAMKLSYHKWNAAIMITMNFRLSGNVFRKMDLFQFRALPPQ